MQASSFTLSHSDTFTQSVTQSHLSVDGRE